MKTRRSLLAAALLALIVPVTAVWLSPTTHGDDDLDEKMEKYTEALGVECTYCHVDGDEEKWTRNKMVAKYMQTEYVDKITVDQKGKKEKISCNYCHKGKAKTIDRTPPANKGGGGYGPGGGGGGPNANKMWQVMQMFTKGLSANCNYCHESMNWNGDNGRKKTTRTMYKDYCKNLYKSDGKVVTCADCHKGKPTFLPTKQDADKKNGAAAKK